jgi:hypothetical protein
MKKLKQSQMPKRLKLPKGAHHCGAAKPPPPLPAAAAQVFKKRGGIKAYLDHVNSSPFETAYFYRKVWPKTLDHELMPPADTDNGESRESMQAKLEVMIDGLIRAQEHDDGIPDVTPSPCTSRDSNGVEWFLSADGKWKRSLEREQHRYSHQPQISAPVTGDPDQEPTANIKETVAAVSVQTHPVSNHSAAPSFRGQMRPDTEPLREPHSAAPSPTYASPPPLYIRPLHSRSAFGAAPGAFAAVALGEAHSEGSELNSTEKFLLWNGHSGTGWRI